MEHLTIYSNPIPLFYHRRKKYANIFDYILTFITIIITIILSGFYYFQLIKKEPYLYHQTDKIENNGNYTFSNLPFFISLLYYKRFFLSIHIHLLFLFYHIIMVVNLKILL